MGWTLEIQEDLGVMTNPEDGTPYTFAVFFIVAESFSGRVFAHDRLISSARVVDGEDGAFIRSTLEEARRSAEGLLARMRAAQADGSFVSPMGRPHWRAVQPVYGSPAYAAEREFWEARADR